MPAKLKPITSTLDPQQDRLLRRTDVEFIVGLCKTSIYAAVKAGTFPAPVRVTDYAVAWRKSEVDAWLASRSKTRVDAVEAAPAASRSARPVRAASGRAARSSRSTGRTTA